MLAGDFVGEEKKHNHDDNASDCFGDLICGGG
jgi:hypothetical protein